MTAGDLRQRVTVQVRTETSDGHGGFTESWAAVTSPDLRRIAAQVQPLEGRELERAKQVDPRITYTVTLRRWRTYRTDLAGGRVRLVHHPSAASAEDLTLDVIGAPVNVDERNAWIRVSCAEAA